MKFLSLLLLMAVAVYSHPAKQAEVLDDSEETFFILPVNRHGTKKQVPSVVEVEVGDSDEDATLFSSYFRPMFFNPFSFMNFGFSDFFSRPSWVDSLMPKDVPDATVKNSTSTTKVVDGHKITVNDTTYENEKNGAVYRFQVIEVLPFDSNEKDDKTSEEKTDKSSDEKEVKLEASTTETVDVKTEATEEAKPDLNSQDNEIHREEDIRNYKLLGEGNPEIDGLIETDDHADSHMRKRQSIVDLSNDIKINELLSENTRRGGLLLIPPEVEVFNTFDNTQGTNNYQQQVIEPFENQAVIHP